MEHSLYTTLVAVRDTFDACSTADDLDAVKASLRQVETAFNETLDGLADDTPKVEGFTMREALEMTRESIRACIESDDIEAIRGALREFHTAMDSLVAAVSP